MGTHFSSGSSESRTLCSAIRPVIGSHKRSPLSCRFGSSPLTPRTLSPRFTCPKLSPRRSCTMILKRTSAQSFSLSTSEARSPPRPHNKCLSFRDRCPPHIHLKSLLQNKPPQTRCASKFSWTPPPWKFSSTNTSHAFSQKCQARSARNWNWQTLPMEFSTKRITCAKLCSTNRWLSAWTRSMNFTGFITLEARWKIHTWVAENSKKGTFLKM